MALAGKVLVAVTSEWTSLAVCFIFRVLRGYILVGHEGGFLDVQVIYYYSLLSEVEDMHYRGKRLSKYLRTSYQDALKARHVRRS